jgi:hypothetical protein
MLIYTIHCGGLSWTNILNRFSNQEMRKKSLFDDPLHENETDDSCLHRYWLYALLHLLDEHFSDYHVFKSCLLCDQNSTDEYVYTRLKNTIFKHLKI